MTTNGSITDSLIIALAAIALVATGVVVDRKMLRPAGAPSGEVVSLEPTDVRDWKKAIATGHQLGAPNAPVTLLEFGDFQCPACRVFALHGLKGIRAKFPQQVRIIFRHWPLPYHEQAYPAARASECAAVQGRFAVFHDLLYAHQDSLGLLTFTQLAQRSGVGDLDAFARCDQDSAAVPAIEADILAAHDIGGTATPTIAINGRLLHAVPDSLGLDRLVSAALEAAGPEH